jgi:acyl-CoA hydrolase
MSLLVEGERKKVADGVFVFVALDGNGKKRAIPE